MRTGVEQLLQDLDSSVEDICKAATIRLAQMGDLSVLPHLERMRGDLAPAVRYFARIGLGKLKAAAAIAVDGDSASGKDQQSDEELAKRLCDPEVGVRREAAAGCARLVSPALATLISARVSVEPDAEVRATLVSALAAQGDPSCREVFLRCLSDSDDRVRANAAYALGGFVDDEKVVLALTPLLEDADNRVRANATLAMGQADPDRVRAAIESMLDSDKAWMKNSGAFTLTELNLAWGRKRLEEIVRGPEYSEAMRARAVEALGGQTSKRSVATEAASSPGPEGGERPPSSNGALLRMRSNVPLLLKGLEGLEAIGTVEALQAVMSVTNDLHPRVRAAAARFLHGSNPGAAIETLRTMEAVPVP